MRAVGECAPTKMGVEMKSFDPSFAGHNGKFVGWGADTLSNGGNDATITVVNNVNRFSVSDLSEINNRGNIHGWTPRKGRRWLPGGPWYGEKVSPYENYTAYDFASYGTNESYLELQTHELGHSLADITDVAVPFKGLPMPSGVDTGAWFLNCVKDAYKPSPQ